MLDWMGCSAAQCPYDKEYADCEYCRFLIRESKNPAKNVDSPKLPVKMTDFVKKYLANNTVFPYYE